MRGIDELKACLRAERHADGDRAVELDHWRSRQVGERVADRDDALPVVFSATRARVWQVAIAAWSAYGPNVPPLLIARPSAARPPTSTQSHRARFCSKQRDRLAALPGAGMQA